MCNQRATVAAAAQLTTVVLLLYGPASGELPTSIQNFITGFSGLSFLLPPFYITHKKLLLSRLNITPLKSFGVYQHHFLETSKVVYWFILKSGLFS